MREGERPGAMVAEWQTSAPALTENTDAVTATISLSRKRDVYWFCTGLKRSSSSTCKWIPSICRGHQVTCCRTCTSSPTHASITHKACLFCFHRWIRCWFPYKLLLGPPGGHMASCHNWQKCKNVMLLQSELCDGSLVPNTFCFFKNNSIESNRLLLHVNVFFIYPFVFVLFQVLHYIWVSIYE